MHWIAHRGNMFGPNPDRENHPDYIVEALDAGYEAEVDVWVEGGRWFLGHDAPTHAVDPEFFARHGERLWCHAKNLDALLALLAVGAHAFSHDNDPVVLTSRAVPWAFPGAPIAQRVVCVMPERCLGRYAEARLRECAGVCSDYVAWYKQRHEASVRIAMTIGGRLTCHHQNLLPQLAAYLRENPAHWIDVHIALNAPPEAAATYGSQPGMRAPYIASLECAPFVATPEQARCVRKNSETNWTHAMSMFHNNKAAYDAARRYAQKNSVRYDAWIKYRPDVVADGMPLYAGDLSALDPGVVYTPAVAEYGNCGKINDQVALAAFDSPAALAYVGVIDHCVTHYDAVPGYVVHPESMLWHELVDKGIRICRYPASYGLDPARGGA